MSAASMRMFVTLLVISAIAVAIAANNAADVKGLISCSNCKDLLFNVANSYRRDADFLRTLSSKFGELCETLQDTETMELCKRLYGTDNIEQGIVHMTNDKQFGVDAMCNALGFC